MDPKKPSSEQSASGIRDRYRTKVCPVCGELNPYGFFCDNYDEHDGKPLPELIWITLRPDLDDGVVSNSGHGVHRSHDVDAVASGEGPG